MCRARGQADQRPSDPAALSTTGAAGQASESCADREHYEQSGDPCRPQLEHHGQARPRRGPPDCAPSAVKEVDADRAIVTAIRTRSWMVGALEGVSRLAATSAGIEGRHRNSPATASPYMANAGASWSAATSTSARRGRRDPECAEMQAAPGSGQGSTSQQVRVRRRAQAACASQRGPLKRTGGVGPRAVLGVGSDSSRRSARTDLFERRDDDAEGSRSDPTGAAHAKPRGERMVVCGATPLRRRAAQPWTFGRVSSVWKRRGSEGSGRTEFTLKVMWCTEEDADAPDPRAGGGGAGERSGDGPAASAGHGETEQPQERERRLMSRTPGSRRGLRVRRARRCP